MTTKVARIFETNNSADLGDTLDGQIDVVWGLIAALETLCRESGYDAYAKGALAIANRHVDALSAIRQNIDQPTLRLRQEMVLPWQRSAANMLTKDKARRIAANVAKLPEAAQALSTRAATDADSS